MGKILNRLRTESEQGLEDLLSGRTGNAPSLPGSLPTKSNQAVNFGRQDVRALIVARNGHSGLLGELTSSGNNEDDESVVKSGLLKTDTYMSVYDDASKTWSRMRGNTALQMRESSVSAASNVTPSFDNISCSGAHFIIDVTAGAAAGNELTCTIQAQDVFTGKWYNVLTGAAIAAVGTVVLKVAPGLPGAVGAVANDILPRKFRVSNVHAGAVDIEYSITASLV